MATTVPGQRSLTRPSGPATELAAPRPGTAVIAAAGVGLGAMELYPPLSGLAMFVVAVAGPVALAVGVRRYRPRRPVLWWTTVLALGLFAVDGVLRVDYATLGVLTRQRSLVPDLVALPGYLLLGATLVGFVLSRTEESELRLGIVYDGAIAGLAMLACSWVFLIGPVLSHRAITESVRAILVCYPAVSLCLMVVTLQIAFAARRHTPAERALVYTMTSMFVGDVLYMLAELHLVAPRLNLLDLPYFAAYVFAARCALHPSMRELTEPVAEPRAGWSAGRIVLVAVAFSVPALLVLQRGRDTAVEHVALFVIVVLLSSMAILQILLALRSAERSKAQLRHQAMHDSLTDLPNRRYLETHLERLLHLPRGPAECIGVLFLDLDRFKYVNDTLGHSHGDALLVQVARRLERDLRARELVTRVGGDEFVVVLDPSLSVADAFARAHELRLSLREPIDLGETEFYVTASIGLALATGGEHAMDAESLIRDADTAMYEAKAAGRDAVAVFDDSMRAELAERIEIERDLRHAADRGELRLVFQPVVRLRRLEVTGVEALLRWMHPRLGLLLPSRFVPLAEESSLIVSLGAWVLDEALRHLARWRSFPGCGELTVAVNLSAVELRDDHLIERIVRTLGRYGLPGSALCIELTESAVMRDPDAAIAVLGQLRRLDVRLAVDDFGTEYSSLAYLQRLPVDVLKIDRSFVEGLTGDGSESSLVAAIVAMARALSIETVAEGVETREQVERLVALGSDAAQGYLFARPVEPDALLETITRIRTEQLPPGVVPDALAVPSTAPAALGPR